MSPEKNSPALTDAKRLGGAIAQAGFDYQLWDGLIRLPAWLRDPAFEGIIFEGLEDLEARFFAPQSPRRFLLERFQAKSGPLARGDLLSIFESFQQFEAKFPNVVRVQTLVVQRR